MKGPRPPRELKFEVLALGVPKSSYHYALRQLIKHGGVNKVEPMYSYRGQRLSDRDVRELLGPVTTAESEAQQIERSKNLVFLAKTPGIVLQPRFLLNVGKCLDSTSAHVRGRTLHALSDVLRELDDAAYAEDKKARDVVNKRLLKKLAGIVHSDADLDVRGIAIEVVAELADPRAVGILLEVVEKASDKEYRRLQNPLQRAIVPSVQSKSYLTRHRYYVILRRLSELAGRGNKRASELADLIRRQDQLMKPSTTCGLPGVSPSLDLTGTQSSEDARV
jgi:hypothetical protein